MSDGGPIGGFAVFAVFLLMHGILYGFGAAVQSLNGSGIEKKAEEGDRRSQKLLHIIEEPARFVNTLLAAITLVNIIAGANVYLTLCRRLLELFEVSAGVWQISFLRLLAWFLPAFFLLTVLMIFGVLTPKRLAQRYPEGWAYGLLGIAEILMLLFSPLTWVVERCSNLVIRLFGVNPHEMLDNVTEEEIRSMVNEGHEQGVLLASEAEMITNIFEFGDKQASDIMTHRKHIVAVDGAWTLKEAVDYILTQSNSRFPVYNKDIDNIIGILHFRDAMIYHEENDTDKPICEIKELLREALFIPETRNINLLFKEMQSQKIHMAIVVDEYGQTAGLVAMEDILEEIVGNIFDEYDEEEEMMIGQEDGSWLVRGMADFDEVWKELSLNIEEEEQYDTLNGFLISRLDRIPQDGESIEVTYKGYLFSSLKIENKTIQLIRVTKAEEEKESAEDTV